LQIDDRAGGDLPRLDQRRQAETHRLHRHPRQRALVDEVARPYGRHAPAIREEFVRSKPLISARAVTSSRRASAFKTSRNASSMVSLMVAVASTRWTASRSSSLISTLVFRTGVFLLPGR